MAQIISEREGTRKALTTMLGRACTQIEDGLMYAYSEEVANAIPLFQSIVSPETSPASILAGQLENAIVTLLQSLQIDIDSKEGEYLILSHIYDLVDAQYDQENAADYQLMFQIIEQAQASCAKECPAYFMTLGDVFSYLLEHPEEILPDELFSRLQSGDFVAVVSYLQIASFLMPTTIPESTIAPFEKRDPETVQALRKQRKAKDKRRQRAWIETMRTARRERRAARRNPQAE